MSIDTLIFDLDGTISDPSEGIARSINHALALLGYETVAEEHVHRMIGPPLTEIFEHFLGPLAEDRLVDLVTAYRDRYATTGYRENVLYDGMPDVIATLSTRGFRLGICTSKRADYAGRILEMFGLHGYFEFIDGGDIHIKKYMQLEKLLANGVARDRAIMIGDRAVDIAAAKRNGTNSVGVTWGFAHAEELDHAGPTQLARSPAELLEMFP